MIIDPLDIILQMKTDSRMTALQQRIRNLAEGFGYDRIVLFSINPSRDEYIDRIYWMEGDWFGVDEKAYIQLCPVRQHFINMSRPFFWRKTLELTGNDHYQIVAKPTAGALHGLQIPVFGPSGIEGALSLAGMDIDGSPRTELILTLLAGEAYRHARRILGLVHERETITLTPREKDVLSLVGKGLRQSDIARVLGISERTVENHLRRSRSRLGVSTTAQAVQVALMTGEIGRRPPIEH